MVYTAHFVFTGLEEQKSGEGFDYGITAWAECVLEWSGGDWRITDFVGICYFLRWKV